MFAVEIEAKIEQQGQGDPKDAQPHGFPHSDDMGFAMKHSQIDG
jgi:hypothetical protein